MSEKKKVKTSINLLSERTHGHFKIILPALFQCFCHYRRLTPSLLFFQLRIILNLLFSNLLFSSSYISPVTFVLGKVGKDAFLFYQQGKTFIRCPPPVLSARWCPAVLFLCPWFTSIFILSLSLVRVKSPTCQVSISPSLLPHGTLRLFLPLCPPLNFGLQLSVKRPHQCSGLEAGRASGSLSPGAYWMGKEPRRA